MTGTHSRLTRWLTSSEPALVAIVPMGGDVSRRSYFHVTLEGGATAVAVDYPEDMRPVCGRFLATTALLEKVGVRVPRILRSDCDHGHMLVEDLGSTPLYSISGHGWEELVPFYSEALSFIRKIERLPTEEIAELNPPLDGALLRKELELSWRALTDAGAVPLSNPLRTRLDEALNELCDHLVEAPMVPCHRDFMARNLMLSGPDGVLTVIDHQDLRLGPAFYDLASLLNDSLFPPPTIEERLRAESFDCDTDLTLYRRCSVQRTVKAAGTFVRFAAQGDTRHIPLVRPTLLRAAHHLRHLSEGGPFVDEITAALTATA